MYAELLIKDTQTERKAWPGISFFFFSPTKERRLFYFNRLLQTL